MGCIDMENLAYLIEGYLEREWSEQVVVNYMECAIKLSNLEIMTILEKIRNLDSSDNKI